MFDDFLQYLESRISITADEWQSIRSVSVARKLDKGQFLLKEGEICRYSIIVFKGCLRTYRSDPDGKIRILNFAIENEWIGDTQSMQTSTPSAFNIDAVEPSEIVLIHKTDFENLCKQLPQFHQMTTDNLKECLSISQARIDLATSPNAEEKYRVFSTYHPQLLLRVPQYMIASYLGMTPESLSRVRKKLAKEQFTDKMLSIAGFDNELISRQ